MSAHTAEHDGIHHRAFTTFLRFAIQAVNRLDFSVVLFSKRGIHITRLGNELMDLVWEKIGVGGLVHLVASVQQRIDMRFAFLNRLFATFCQLLRHDMHRNRFTSHKPSIHLLHGDVLFNPDGRGVVLESVFIIQDDSAVDVLQKLCPVYGSV